LEEFILFLIDGLYLIILLLKDILNNHKKMFAFDYMDSYVHVAAQAVNKPDGIHKLP